MRAAKVRDHWYGKRIGALLLSMKPALLQNLVQRSHLVAGFQEQDYGFMDVGYRLLFGVSLRIQVEYGAHCHPLPYLLVVPHSHRNLDLDINGELPLLGVSRHPYAFFGQGSCLAGEAQYQRPVLYMPVICP